MKAKAASLSDGLSSIPDYIIPDTKKLKKPTKAQFTTKDIGFDLDDVSGHGTKADSSFAVGSKGTSKSTLSLLDEKDFLSNGGSQKSNEKEEGTTESGQPIPKVPAPTVKKAAPLPPAPTDGTDGGNSDGSDSSQMESQDGSPTNKSAIAHTPSVMPSFQVNDSSRIDIMACEHEFETSMARNDFSSQSTEASMSGGFGGFSVTVSAGYASSKSNSTKTTNDTYQKTLVAKYLVRYPSIAIS